GRHPYSPHPRLAGTDLDHAALAFRQEDGAVQRDANTFALLVEALGCDRPTAGGAREAAGAGGDHELADLAAEPPDLPGPLLVELQAQRVPVLEGHGERAIDKRALDDQVADAGPRAEGGVALRDGADDVGLHPRPLLEGQVHALPAGLERDR